MIPSKLTLNNFMSYKGQTDVLDFDNWNVACITGDNGNGKSAILEAITWSVWGKTRVQSSKDLVSKGENEMHAEFEFYIDYLTSESLENSKYRILRSLKSKGSQRLNVEQFNGIDFISISGNTVAETQNIIEKLVNMNYETFVNTSYLMQGNADRFSKSQPTKRKEILSEILNLNKWQKLSDFTRKKLSETKNSVEVNKLLLDRTTDELLKLDPDQLGLENHRNELKEIDNEINDSENIRNDFQDKLNHYNELQNNSSRNNDKLLAVEEKLNSTIDEINFISKEIKEDKKLLLNAAQIKIDYNNVLEQYTELDKLTNVFTTYQDLNFELSEIQLKISTESNRFELELKNLSDNLNDLKNNIAQEKNSYINNQLTVEKLNLEIKDSKLTKEQLQNKINSELKSIDNINNDLLKNNTIIDDLNKKIDLLNNQNQVCPLCKSDIDNNSKKNLIDNFKCEITSHSDLIVKSQNNLDNHQKQYSFNKELIDKIGNEISDLENKIKYLTSENNKIKVLGENYKNKIDRISNEINGIKDYKKTNKDFITLKNQEKDLYEKIDFLDFDKDKYYSLQKKIPNIKSELEKELFYLEQAEKRYDRNIIKLNTIDVYKLNIQSEIEIIEQNLKTILDEINSIDIDLDKIKLNTIEIDELTNKKHFKLNYIQNLESKIKLSDEIKSNNKNLFLEQDNLDVLVKSFGTNGIQSQIIEYSLPELSRETNKLLSSLTEHGLSVEFRKVEGRKISGTESYSQEIEIFIADHNGVVRDYETYSGGESFRIDFAIRIALSRLISLRSGVRSPILFIDEGFGSQDQMGQDRLREAIQAVSVSDDYMFKKIIIITHLETLKESFDRAVEVTKLNGISSFSLN